jgi:TolB-like protein/DNA-binding winged helix-turn-helix (wHTH) protein
MSATAHPHSVLIDTRLQLADLVIDPVAARVTRGPDEIPLPRLSWELLLVLVELAPGIVTTETLLNRVWPGLVVNPETVSQRVKLLRTALGDDPRKPRYIEVVRGRGCRLASPVVRLAAAVEPAPLPDAPVAVAPAVPRRRLVVIATALAAVAVVAAVSLWQVRRESPASAPVVSTGPVAKRSIAVRPFQALGMAQGDEVLALGVAEAIRTQLGKLHDVEVTARSSSSSAEIARMGARNAGASLGVAYVLEGSVQSVGSQVRITAQLVEVASGKQLWSQPFDRSNRDTFAVWDEIALKVAQALELRLDAAVTQQLLEHDTKNYDAWLEFAQARKLLDGGRVADLPAANKYLDRAISLDGDFAQAYVERGATLLRQAEFDPGADRRTAFEVAKLEAARNFDQAIAIDPRDGHARLQRAYLLSFSDLDAAEREYRLGLSMAPNDAAGYEGLAAVLYQDPQRQDEVLEALDQARRLDPLEPRYDITKSAFYYFGRGDTDSARIIVQKVLEQHSQYAPALSRMAGIETSQGHLALGIRYNELALQKDPSHDWARRQLISLYLDLGEAREARAVLSEVASDIPVRRLELLVDSGQWQAAGELAYAGLESDTVLAFDEPAVALALRRHARVTGEFDTAVAALESLVQLRWSSDDEPRFPDYTDMRLYVAGVGDLLMKAGQEERGRRVLRLLLAQIEDARVKLQRGGHWTHLARAEALALLGDSDGAVQALRSGLKDGLLPQRYRLMLDLEPAFDSLRKRADFRALRAEVVQVVREQQAELQKLRSEDLVPKR